MKILGTLTDYGEKLYAESVTNNTKIEITRIAAGSGETPLSNESILNHQMYLTLTSEVIDGETVYYGLLNMASATSSFTLREIGLYVTRSYVRLYKIYRLSQPIEIDNTQDHTIRFTFRDRDISHEIFDGYAMPESIVTYEMLNERMGAMTRYIDETVNYSCSADGLEAVLESIPKCIEKNYIINLTSATVNSLKLEGFYGRGSLTLIGYNNNQTNAEDYTRIDGVLTISDCTAKVNLQKFRIVCNSYYNSSLDIHRCSDVVLTQCSVGAMGEAYMARVYGSNVFFESCYVSASKGSGVFSFNEDSHIRMSYRKSDMFDRAFIASGIAFMYVYTRSDVTFLEELTESAISSLLITVSNGALTTHTGTGTDMKTRYYY